MRGNLNASSFIFSTSKEAIPLIASMAQQPTIFCSGGMCLSKTHMLFLQSSLVMVSTTTAQILLVVLEYGIIKRIMHPYVGYKNGKHTYKGTPLHRFAKEIHRSSSPSRGLALPDRLRNSGVNVVFYPRLPSSPRIMSRLRIIKHPLPGHELFAEVACFFYQPRRSSSENLVSLKTETDVIKYM
ncbi:Hypothetical predicted protein [Podarcis lilfordi]|uniref:Uncharacterized protein n=1 Tax=Podarcis lilfordi TaxID=74358 RepID=A0AA35KPW9_9SAUR|nr:Hypothetical predicted protein [Podarcis lilfordi]